VRCETRLKSFFSFHVPRFTSHVKVTSEPCGLESFSQVASLSDNRQVTSEPCGLERFLCKKRCCSGVPDWLHLNRVGYVRGETRDVRCETSLNSFFFVSRSTFHFSR
jgi:hypothetical protein